MTSKRASTGVRRRRSAASYRKLAVSVPSELVGAVEHEVRAGNAPSVSAFISDAVEEKLERDRLQEALDEVWRERPMTRRERAWADRLLGG
ncbi:MAG: ribbon-helix-helix protein, CopG family [Myxococcales bacterium]|nr:ribbon-helix-helix protein, CopG family [Myxococcales bacterium]